MQASLLDMHLIGVEFGLRTVLLYLVHYFYFVHVIFPNNSSVLTVVYLGLVVSQCARSARKRRLGAPATFLSGFTVRAERAEAPFRRTRTCYKL